ncbi:MAG: glucosamine-6-phosphate deaminase [Syntrophothermus sp.]
MQIIVAEDYDELSRRAAETVAAQIREKPDTVLGLATGGTPLGMYRELRRLYQEGKLDFSRTRTFNLDEYIGLAADHPESYHFYMWENFFRHVNLPADQTHIPDGAATDLAAECRRYEEMIQAAGWIDLQILGIGANGHIGFNEPGTEFGAVTHVLRLDPRTIKANARFFGSEDLVPRQAISMGIKTIMKSRRIILLASGTDKAEAITRTVNGPVTVDMPASILQLHPNVTLLVDKAAAALLKLDGGQLTVNC